jgi:hypothetical protein
MGLLKYLRTATRGNSTPVARETEQGWEFEGVPKDDRIIAAAKSKEGHYFVLHQSEGALEYSLHAGKDQLKEVRNVSNVGFYRDGGSVRVDYTYKGEVVRIFFGNTRPGFEPWPQSEITYGGKKAKLESIVIDDY